MLRPLGRIGDHRRRRHSAMLKVIVVALLLAVTGGAIYRSVSDWLVDDKKFSAEIIAAARRHGLAPELVRALVFEESRFKAGALGGKGEVGLMQLLPGGAVAEYCRVKRVAIPDRRGLYSPRVNLEIGCWYLALGFRRYAGYRAATELALGRYNAGERRADRWRPDRPDDDVIDRIDIPGTRRYVENIMKRYRRYLQESDFGKR